jgi:anti-sigma regulatory factor (Ser/Thr protein kinase)
MGADTSSSQHVGEGRTEQRAPPRAAGHPLPAAGAERRSDVRLTVPARPENVAVVRHLLGGLAEALRLPASVVDDMRLAVTEACTNVVRHAYAGRDGLMEVLIRPGPHALQVVVADRGRGIGPTTDSAGPGLGLPLIAALTDSLEIQHGPERGSRLAMSFSRHRASQRGEAA